jgi:hypothetical protein
VTVPSLKRSRGSSVGIATAYGLDGWGSIPGRGKRFFSTASKQALGLPLGINRPGREADHSPPSTAEVKNGRAITHSPISLLVVMLN